MAAPTAAAYRAVTRNNGVRSAPRVTRDNTKTQNSVAYRVGKGQGKVMIAVATLLDVMPLLLLVALVALVIGAAGAVGGTAGGFAAWVCKHAGYAADAYFAVGNIAAWTANSWQMAFGGSATWQTNVGCNEASAAVGTVAAGATMLSGGAATWWLWGLVYWFAAFMASLLSILIFPAWFALNRYNMLSFLCPKRVSTNLISFMCTGLFKMAPVLNLFPFPVYSLTVWRHIRLAQAEDRELHKKAAAAKRARRRPVDEGLWEA